MNATTLALVLAIISGVAALLGTIYSQRKGGPEFTSNVLGSMDGYLKRLDDDMVEMRAEIADLKVKLVRETDRVADLTGEVLAVRQAFAVERIYVGMLVGAMKAAGVDVPPRPETDVLIRLQEPPSTDEVT